MPAGPVLVDTDVFSYVHYQKDRWQDFEVLLLGHPLALSFACVGELRAGAIKSNWGVPRQSAQQRFMSTYTIIRPTTAVVDEYAILHASLHDKLSRGGVNDMWTAACALAYGLPVATNNLSDFLSIGAVASDLKVIHPDL